MADQRPEVKKLTGTPLEIKPTKGYEGRNGYLVTMQVTRADGNVAKMPLSVLAQKNNPSGPCPFEVGKTVEFEYTVKEVTKEGPEGPETAYYYNYRWPWSGGGGGGRGGYSSGPSIIFRAAQTPKDITDRSYSVELSCPPSDDLHERAAQVNASLNALIATASAGALTATKPAAPRGDAFDREEQIDEDGPNF